MYQRKQIPRSYSKHQSSNNQHRHSKNKQQRRHRHRPNPRLLLLQPQHNQRVVEGRCIALVAAEAMVVMMEIMVAVAVVDVLRTEVLAMIVGLDIIEADHHQKTIPNREEN